MTLTKIESFLFYPVLFFATLFTLQAWTNQPVAFAVVLSVATLILWCAPLLKEKFNTVLRVTFWLVTFGLFSCLLYVLAMFVY